MGLWKDKKRGDWRYAFQAEGKVYAGGGFETKASAKSAREERRKKVKSPPPETKTGMDFLTVCNLYLDWSQRRHAKKTHEYKRMVFKCFISHHGNLEISQITPQHLHEYLNTRPSNHNYNAHRKDLCALFTFAIQQLQTIEKNPCWTLEKLPEDRKEKKIPTYEEFLRLLAAASKDERPLLVILAHTMARVDEILRLTWQDVNFEKEIVVLWTRKNAASEYRPRSIPMNRDLSNTLMSMWKRRKQEKWVFYNAKEDDRYNRRPKLMRSLCRRAGIDGNYGFHAIRHFVATYSHDVLKVPTGVLSGILGHESKRTTEIYLHSVDEARREAIGKLEGLIPEDVMEKTE